ncbi:MAG TPA: 1,4-dihydroxy-2-naphthoate polyprenyltransferase [Flavobacteriales bacterium]|nr:1,4-dihydroxy-2-naphthoate polyprenyltransferase [Flavobacteriales bacterium]
MKPWIQAFRLRTLPLAVSSIIVGSASAAYLQKLSSYLVFRPVVLVLALLTAILLQVLSNLANDLGDHQHGADNVARVGPKRSVQSGTITPGQMKKAMLICGLLAFLAGCALIVVALGLTVKSLLFLLLGLSAIAAAVKYTFGKDPYGYAGFGDVSVFLFFGIVGVCGTFYLHSRYFDWPLLLPATAFGLLSAAVLNVNNMRDIENDRATGKFTVAVRMGGERARLYHSGLVVGAILCLFVSSQLGSDSHWLLLSLLSLPIFIVHLKKVWTTTEPRALDPQLKVLAMGTFFTALLFSLGLILA